MEPTVRIDGFTQDMDNRRPDFALVVSSEEGGGSLLRDAVNVDVTAQGSVKTRAGYELVESGLNCHSGWSQGITGNDFKLGGWGYPRLLLSKKSATYRQRAKLA